MFHEAFTSAKFENGAQIWIFSPSVTLFLPRGKLGKNEDDMNINAERNLHFNLFCSNCTSMKII